MLTPVLIPARNEAEHIGEALSRLPASVEPIVIPNGCVEGDNTAAIADYFGAKVINDSPEGKLPAIQMGVRYLGRRATEPFIVLDADSYPLFPNSWLRAMVNGQDREEMVSPQVINGPVIYNKVGLVTAAWRNAGHWRNLIRTRNQQEHGVCGANMLLRLGNPSAVEALLELPNYWPRDDAAIRDEVLRLGGTSAKLLHPAAIVLTDGDRFPGLFTRIGCGKDISGQKIIESYLEEAAPGSVPYLAK